MNRVFLLQSYSSAFPMARDLSKGCLGVRQRSSPNTWWLKSVTITSVTGRKQKNNLEKGANQFVACVFEGLATYLPAISQKRWMTTQTTRSGFLPGVVTCQKFWENSWKTSAAVFLKNPPQPPAQATPAYPSYHHGQPYLLPYPK